MTLKEAALAYHDAGLCVFPLPPGKKKATMAWGQFQHTRPSRAQVEAWWTETPDSNIAVITGEISNLAVVDVDVPKGNPGPFIGLTQVWARTQRGGFHYWFRYPGHAVKSVAGVLPGVDVRGDGGYIVAPPSVGEHGRYYWEGPGLPEAREHYDFAKAEALCFPTTAQPARIEEPGWLAKALIGGIPIGEQRQSITRLAGYFAKKGIPADVAYATIWTAITKSPMRGGEPWLPDQVRECVYSIYAKEGGPRSSKSEERPALALQPLIFDDFMARYEGAYVEWTIEDWLPQATVGLIVSPPGNFKTFLLLDLALSVAMGKPFLDRYPVHVPGPVIFLQQEDPGHLLANRAGPMAVQKQYGGRAPAEGEWFDRPKGIPLHMYVGSEFLFTDPAAQAVLEKRVEEIKPVLVLMDPLYAMSPLDNFLTEVAHHFGFLKKLRNKHGCSFMIAHHTKKKGEDDAGREQMWGSQLLNAAMETGWQSRAAGSKRITMSRHFKVSGNISAKQYDFDIDLDRVPAVIVSEKDIEVEGVDPDENLDDSEKIVLAYVQQEGPIGIRDLATKTGISKATAERRLRTLIEKGLVVKGKDKKYTATRIEPKEVTGGTKTD